MRHDRMTDLLVGIFRRPHRWYTKLAHRRFHDMKYATGGMMPAVVYERMHDLAQANPDLDVIEVGAGTGAGTIALAWGLADAGGNGRVITIEKCEGGTRDLIGDYGDNLDVLRANFAAHDVDDRIRIFPHLIDRARLDECLALVSTDRIGMLVHDADGRIDRDFELFWPLLIDGGGIVIDDVGGGKPKAEVTHRLLAQMVEWGLFVEDARVRNTVFGHKPAGADITRLDRDLCERLVAQWRKT